MEKNISKISKILLLFVSIVNIAAFSVTKRRDLSWNDYFMPEQVHVNVYEDAILQCYDNELTSSSITWYKVSFGETNLHLIKS